MSTRSNVGLALHKDVELSTETLEWLSNLADEKHECDEGTLFIMESVKWSDLDPDVTRLMMELKPYEAKYLLVDACMDYPSSDENDSGGWDDNPWRLGKFISVNLTYEA